jgi:phosphoribosylanthranilate isomerase
MWIKICANTNLDDAQLAIQLGANAVGFVFAPSKRHVTPAQVAAITPHLAATHPHVERVGVFQHHTPAEIATIVREAHLTAAQLHSGSDPILLAELRTLLPPSIRIIPTIHWPVHSDPVAAAVQARIQLQQLAHTLPLGSEPALVLIDSKVGQASGGTGVAFDWSAARALFSEFAPTLRIIAAGGLNPANLATAIRELQPWGVDVASGVEAQPGRKDPIKLSEFIRIAKE